MLRFFAYHTGFSPAALMVSVAVHGAVVLALFGFIPITGTAVSVSPNPEPQVFEIAFGPLPEPAAQAVDQATISAETIKEEIPNKEAIMQVVPKAIKKNTKMISKTDIIKNQVEPSANSSALSNTTTGEKSSQRSPQQLMNLSSWINRHRFYPSDARRKGEEGTVLVRISFTSAGDLETYRVIRSSGSNALDRAAAEILKRSAPYPAELVATFSHAEVPLVFSLRS